MYGYPLECRQGKRRVFNKDMPRGRFLASSFKQTYLCEMDRLENLDHQLTLAINQMGTDWMDPIMVLISEKYTWIPLYALLLWAFYKKMDGRTLLAAVLGAVLVIACTDLISVHAFKNVFERWRPCHHLVLSEQLRLPDGCGGRFGFLSSHATNTAGLAVFAGLVLRNRWWWAAMLLYAFLNSFSRIYLGKHYFSDVVAGMVLGAAIGSLVYLLFQSIEQRLLLRHENKL